MVHVEDGDSHTYGASAGGRKWKGCLQALVASNSGKKPPFWAIMSYHNFTHIRFYELGGAVSVHVYNQHSVNGETWMSCSDLKLQSSRKSIRNSSL